MKRLYSEKQLKRMVTFYFICILLLIHHESTYCEEPSTADTAATFNTRTIGISITTTDRKATEYSLRLAHGKFGRIEIKMQTTWDYVCSNNFNDADATVVCRELGYNGGFAYILARWWSSELSPRVSSFACTGKEKTIRDCRDFTGGNASNCESYSYAAAYCYNNSGYEFRLTNPSFPLVTVSTSGFGHVEMAIDGEWRPLCGIWHFDYNPRLIDFVCQQLGYSRGIFVSRSQTNSVEKIWAPFLTNCDDGVFNLFRCPLILDPVEEPYDSSGSPNSRYRGMRHFSCKEGFLPTINCF